MDGYTCDVCGRTDTKNVVAGRWIFYCKDNPKCKEVEQNKIHEEISPDIESGDFSYTLEHGLSEYIA